MTTIGDVAKRAGVSKVTVSRVLNGASNVNAQTRERVQQAIAELQYLPNLAARSLRSRQTQTVALVVPDITNVFWTTVARGAEDTAQRRGYSVLLGNTDENPDKQQSYLSAMLQQKVDGVMIAPTNSDAERMGPLRDRQIPTVVIDRKLNGWEVDAVRGDSAGGARSLTEHLLGLGYNHIAMITGPRGASTAEERVGGYALALRKAGLPVDKRLVRWGEFRVAWGERLAGEILDEELRPDAIFAANNAVALGVLECLIKRGLRVPQDIALVCFDEMADVARLFQFFSVASQPAYEIGSLAAARLIDRIQGIEKGAPAEQILPSRLTLRYSCGRLIRAAPYTQIGLLDANLGTQFPVVTMDVPLLDGQEQVALAECIRDLAGD
jgi:LacI family transcriptional regulator